MEDKHVKWGSTDLAGSDNPEDNELKKKRIELKKHIDNDEGITPTLPWKHTQQSIKNFTIH
jgi:hypothetical protein